MDSRYNNNYCKPEERIWYHSLLKFTPTSMRFEAELLICCARVHLNPEITERIQSLSQKRIDWKNLLDIAYRHRVMPLLSWNLRQLCVQTLPTEIMQQLHAYLKQNTRRNLVLSGRLHELLKRLKENQIPALTFKGPTLAENVYGSLALRQFGDLDIVVDKHDAFRARNLLLSLGYRSEFGMNDSQFKVFVKTKNSAPFISDEGEIAVDLHWEMTGKYSLMPFDLNTLAERVIPATLAGKPIDHLCPEDLLLYLCHHGCQHCWEKLEMICSVSELVRSNADMDWERITNLAAQKGCERIVFLGLFLANDLFGAPLPSRLLKIVRTNAKICKLATEIYNGLFSKDRQTLASGLSSKFSFFHLNVRERLSEKIRYGLHLTINPTKEEWRLLPLPASLAAIFYMFRPVRLAAGLAMVLLRRGWRNST